MVHLFLTIQLRLAEPALQQVCAQPVGGGWTFVHPLLEYSIYLAGWELHQACLSASSRRCFLPAIQIFFLKAPFIL